LHTTNTSSQTHIDFTGFYKSSTESNIEQLQELEQDRKTPGISIHQNLIDQFSEPQQNFKGNLAKKNTW